MSPNTKNRIEIIPVFVIEYSHLVYKFHKYIFQAIQVHDSNSVNFKNIFLYSSNNMQFILLEYKTIIVLIKVLFCIFVMYL